MNVPIHQVPSDVDEHGLHGLGAHAQELGKETDADAVQALEDILHLQGAELLLLLPLGPGVPRHGEDLLADVLEAGLAQPPLVLHRVEPAAAEERERVVEHLVPALQGRAVERPVDRLQLHVVVLHLYPAARVQVLADGGEELGEVADRADHVAPVDVVELVREYPVVLYVVYLEPAVWRHAGRVSFFLSRSRGGSALVSFLSRRPRRLGGRKLTILAVWD